MLVGFWGPAAWSFLMATAHGAGLMLWPVMLATCIGGGAVGDAGYFGVLGIPVTAVGVHTLAMVATTAIVAGLVHEWLRLAVLRRAWANVDVIWVWALVLTSGLLLANAS